MLGCRYPSFHLQMAPTHKSSDAGNSNRTKRSRQVLPLGEKVEGFDLTRQEKYHGLRSLRCTMGAKTLHPGNGEEGRRNTPQTAEAGATVRGQCFVGMEEA